MRLANFRHDRQVLASQQFDADAVGPERKNLGRGRSFSWRRVPPDPLVHHPDENSKTRVGVLKVLFSYFLRLRKLIHARRQHHLRGKQLLVIFGELTLNADDHFEYPLDAVQSLAAAILPVRLRQFTFLPLLLSCQR